MSEEPYTEKDHLRDEMAVDKIIAQARQAALEEVRKAIQAINGDGYSGDVLKQTALDVVRRLMEQE